MQIRSRWLQLTLQLLAAMIGALFFIWVLGPASYHIGGFKVQTTLRPAVSGRTVIELPPLGSLTAKTHSAPLQCQLTLLGVEEGTIVAVLANPDPGELQKRVWQDARWALTLFALRQVGLGILGATLGVWFLYRLKCKVWQPALAGFLLTVTWLAPAWLTYRVEAFKHPAYDGIIAAAPRVLELSTDLVSALQEFKDVTPEVVANLKALFNQVDELNTFTTADNGIKILLVSDIHNNLAGLAFACNLAAHFAVDVVLDAGDLTDFGSPLELNLVQSLDTIKVPYVFTPGNHDSPVVMDFLSLQPGVHVLKGEVIHVAGLNILGSPDPSAYRSQSTVTTPAQEEAELRVQGDVLIEALNQTEQLVDVVLVHDLRVACRFVGRVPLIAYGHTHRTNVESSGESVLLNPGTTGAAGIRGLRASQEIPYSAIVAYLDAGKRPTAVDIITYQPQEGSFRVERRIVTTPRSHSTEGA